MDRLKDDDDAAMTGTTSYNLDTMYKKVILWGWMRWLSFCTPIPHFSPTNECRCIFNACGEQFGVVVIALAPPLEVILLPVGFIKSASTALLVKNGYLRVSVL